MLAHSSSERQDNFGVFFCIKKTKLHPFYPAVQCLLTHVSQGVRIAVVTILQRGVGEIGHEIVSWLSGLKS